MMRCPKCGFNSYDHNLNCPKCRKDLSVIRRQLNLTMPVPGQVNFFQTAGQRSVFPEPVLGAEAAEDAGLADPFSAPPFAGAAPYAAAGLAGGAAAMSPFGTPGQPMAPGPMIDDILPAEDDIDDIAPIEDIAPAPGFYPEAAPPVYPQAAPQAYPSMPPQGYPQMPPQAPPAFAPAPQAPMAPPSFAPAPQAPMAPPSFGSPVAPPMPPQATGMAALAPELAEDEIEIEIDALDDSMPSAAPIPETVSHQANAAMDQIKTTLAETGDLAAQAAGNLVEQVEVFAVPEAPAQQYQPAPAPVQPPQPLADFDPGDYVLEPDGGAAAAPGAPQAPAQPQPAKEDLTTLVDEINLDDLDSDL